MNISEKVSFYATVPMAIIVVLVIVAAAFLIEPIDAKVNIILSMLTAVTLLFYVSERLRESASRKLDYWNKKVLTPEYHVIEGLNPLWSATYRANALGRDRDLLKKYARYGRFVKLYPKNFILTLSMAQRYLTEYQKVYEIVLNEGNKRLGLNKFNLGALFVAMGLEERGNYDETQIENHRKVLDDSGVIEGLTNTVKLTLVALTSVRADIETLLVENQMSEARA